MAETEAQKAARVAKAARAAKAYAHIDTLGETEKDFALDHWEWLAEGQQGTQPEAPADLAETRATEIRHSLNGVHHS